MILQASTIKNVGHAGQLADHLLKRENDQVIIQEVRGSAAPTVRDTLQDMQRMTGLTKGNTGLFHVAINPHVDKAGTMSPDQWQACLNAIEKEFELSDQPRILVQHVKEGRTHVHAVWQLTDVDSCTLKRVSHYKTRCQEIGRKLERDLNHELTNRNVSRNTFDRHEQQKAKRNGEKVQERRDSLRDDFSRAESFSDWQQRLQGKGYRLAQGERAALILVNEKGDVFGLTRELGIKLKEAETFIGSNQIKQLPTLAQLKEDRSITPSNDNRQWPSQREKLFTEFRQEIQVQTQPESLPQFILEAEKVISQTEKKRQAILLEKQKILDYQQKNRSQEKGLNR